MLFKGDSLNKQVGLTPHYYFIPTVYITRCVLACLVEVLTTRLSRIIQSGLKYSLTTQCCLKTVLFKGDSLNKQVGTHFLLQIILVLTARGIRG